MEHYRQQLSGLFPKEVLGWHPLKEPILLEILPGEQLAIPTWWEMLRLLAALQVGIELGCPTYGTFGFWN